MKNISKMFSTFATIMLLQSAVVSASVVNNIDEGINYRINYPIVYTNDQTAQDKINQNIQGHVTTFKTDFDEGRFFGGAFSYEVKFEDDDYISLTMTDSRYEFGAAHGYYGVYGIVYDKHTGEKLPLSRFLKITTDDLQNLSKSHFYNSIDEEISLDYSEWTDNQPIRVSEDYYFLGDGGIALIYQIYELAAYAEGSTTIRLSGNEVEYFNRKNKNLR